MSLILDALRKSERSRQQSLTGRLGAADAPPAVTRMAVPWITLLGLVLVINAVVLAVLFWPRSEPPAATVTPTPTASAQAYRPDVRPLADEAGTPAPDAAVPVAAAPQAAAAAAAPQIATVIAQNSSADLPTLDSLPADFRQTLPALHLDVHGYAVKPADRFVVIDLQRYRIGDTLPAGPRVVDIVPQGAVLEFHGTRFLLPTT
jgi:general secretion pathway protein B